MVGLYYLEKNDFECPVELHTSWNPKDKSISVARSREFVAKSFLGSSVDSLDAYMILCDKKPKLFKPEISLAIERMDNARSVNSKFELLYKKYIKNDDLEFQCYGSLIALAIQWRNKLLHFSADNKVEECYINNLTINAKFFEDNCNGLNVREMLGRFNQGNSPSFKEVTSIAASVHRFIQILDERLLQDIGITQYATNIIENEFGKNESFYKADTLKQKNKCIHLLKINGFVESNMGLSEEELDDIISDLKK